LLGTVASTGTPRFEGYKRALAKHGLPFDPTLVRDCGFSEHDGYEAMKAWITEGNLPGAVFAANDPAAIGAMNALFEAGRAVPGDVALVGGGRIHYGDMLRVPLTTVAWSTIGMGEAAAHLLIDLIEGEQPQAQQQIILEPELLVRESCGAQNRQRAQGV
jgi:DNA-binding LacI/PurR family transcriptional regulator